MSRQHAPVEAGRQGRIATWLDHHLYSVVAGLGRLLRRPAASLLTIAVLALALALPLGLFATLWNLQRFAGDVEASAQIDAFLRADVAGADAVALAERVRARADVARAELRTPEQGLQELRGRGGLGDAVDALESNPLPHVLVVVPRGDAAALAAALAGEPGVDTVLRDAAWRERLDAWLGVGARLAWVLAAVFGAGALLVVGNTVRLDLQAQREELGVLQLLGATDGFIRRPYLYLGALYGLTAGVGALGLLTAADVALRAPLAALAASYGGTFALDGFGMREAALCLLGASLLGWLGAGVATGHHLRRTRPA